MAKKIYILLKDSPELKKGAILEEECDDGEQDFECINFEKFGVDKDQDAFSYTRDVVMEQPKWFKEVKRGFISMDLPKGLRKKLRKFLTYEK